MSQLVVDGLLTDYRSLGSGQTVLILHGWGDKKESFDPLAESLAKKFQVITIDLPGFGKTQAPKEVWGLNDYVNFVANFCSKLKLKPSVVIGHSNGGAIAIRGLSTKKLAAQKLVLLSSAGIRGEYKGRNLVIRMIAKTGKLLTLWLPKGIRRKLKEKLYKTVGSDMLVAEHLQETFKNVVSDDVRDDAKNVESKTLLLYGQDDTATPPRYAQLLSDNLASSEVKIIPEAGHFVFVDQQEQVINLITEFLK